MNINNKRFYSILKTYKNFEKSKVFMIKQIWSILTQILFDKNDLAEILKPFFQNLNNENINDEKYLQFLQTFPKFQLDALFKNEIITEKTFYTLFPSQTRVPSVSHQGEENVVQKIISGDKVDELRKLIQNKDINTFITINDSFREVPQMKIPLIQYCIMKNAIECFKYLLVNGYDDPNKVMEDPITQQNSIKRYQWNSMSTAIYMGNKEIIKILETRGIKKENDPKCLEAAILSYRNLVAKEIIESTQSQNILDFCLCAASKNNNIIATQLLINKGSNINYSDTLIF